ncbi:MAG: hypothetical protein E6G94_16315 [Alphaproteobacteria bacterium]|nr:MAG: hypothetical protein E6G94_16315 [Alphaproteobacteria bacterium]
MHKFFFKANDDVLSHCTCAAAEAPATSSSQLDCPWCGCGWLISCGTCGKAFTSAEVRETDVPLVEFGRREVAMRGLEHVSEAEIADWAEGMAEMLDNFEVGDTIAYLDGSYWQVDETGIHFDGYYASHRLDRLPHAEALQGPELLDRLLGDPKYWFERERADRGED